MSWKLSWKQLEQKTTAKYRFVRIGLSIAAALIPLVFVLYVLGSASSPLHIRNDIASNVDVGIHFGDGSAYALHNTSQDIEHQLLGLIHKTDSNDGQIDIRSLGQIKKLG